ncbi:hypothetical protein NL494_28345, partial [Klebsiella pneumoniae]|nr:hypothetical protein [Klebsiella pneumoniae]
MSLPPFSRRSLLLAGAATVAAPAAIAPGALAQTSAGTTGTVTEPTRIRLRLLETTDLHVNVYPYDYYRDRTDD